MAHGSLLAPLSPLSRSISTPIVTLYVMGVLELEVAINKAQTLHLLECGLLPLSKRFSSVIVTDETGIARWKKVHCSVEDLLVIPTFPRGLSPEQYDQQLQDYISRIYMEPLPESLPPWQVHLITYPTSNASGSLVFKLNHALGDGYSFMGCIFSMFRKADDLSRPLSFPTASSRMNKRSSSTTIFSKFSTFVTNCMDTVAEFSRAMRDMHLEDDVTVLRSNTPKVEYMPVNISSVTFSLDDMKAIKSKVEATLNDVTTGIIAYAMQLYMKRKGQVPNNPQARAMFPVNLRMFEGFKTIEEMLRANIWGNHFVFMSIPLAYSTDIDNVNPMEYVTKSKSDLKRMTGSMGAYVTSKYLDLLGRLRGPKVVAQCIHSGLKNTTIMVSNMCGPTEKAAVAGLGHHVGGFYFTVPGVPQSLVFTIVTYMGKLRLVATTEKGFIDSQLLVSCLKEAFQKIRAAAVGNTPCINMSHSNTKLWLSSH